MTLMTNVGAVRACYRGAVCLLLGAGLGAVAAGPVTTPPKPNGEQIFRQRCHSNSSSNPPAIGPGLAGIIGRRAASVKYSGYSPVIKRSNIIWTKENLDRFLSNPAAILPGTRMGFGISDQAQRTAVIGYLAEIH